MDAEPRALKPGITNFGIVKPNIIESNIGILKIKKLILLNNIVFVLLDNTVPILIFGLLSLVKLAAFTITDFGMK